MKIMAACFTLALSAFQALPGRAGMANDYAHVLQPDAVVELEMGLSRLRREAQTELVLVTLRDARGAGAEQVAARIRDEWGIGGEGVGEWPGLVVVYLDQTAEIGVSYNDQARSWIPRGEMQRIIDDVALPLLEQGDRSNALRDLMRSLQRLFEP